MNNLTPVFKLSLFVLILLSFSSCKTKSKLDNSANLTEINYKYKDLKQIINSDHNDFETLEAKLKLKVDLKTKITAKATLRMVKDEKVWMSVSYLGFEVARLFMDKESVNVLDKINKKHYELLYESWNTKYGTDFTISHFQKILLGQAVEPINRQFDWKQIDQKVTVSNQNTSEEKYWMFYEIQQNSLTNQTINAQDKTLSCDYSSNIIDVLIPEIMNVNLTLKNNIKVEMITNKVEKNPTVKMPFKVSSKYATVKL